MTRGLNIGLSMRVVCSEYGEWRDALSHDIVDYVEGQGLVATPIPNSLSPTETIVRDLALLVLTGGDNFCMPSSRARLLSGGSRRDAREWALLEAAVRADVPVLGICRGAQVINAYFGGTCAPIALADAHVDIEHGVRIQSKRLRSLLRIGDEELVVNSFHRLGLKSVGKGVMVSAVACDGEIEAIEHETLLIVGLMWHPERACSNPAFRRAHAGLVRRLLRR
jgi:gamma-glutamyl-gamma-aminobutyrate hydrolase PuuD